MNAALRAVVKAAEQQHGIEIVGFRDGFAGLLADDALPLSFDAVSGILVRGGTILGASNKDDPFRVPAPGGTGYVDRSDALLATLSRHGIDGLIVIGGDGSLRIADRLGAKGLPVVCVPKTIDDDVAGTDITLGFDSARSIATEAVDRLHTTAASHHRLMVLEVMGRNTGWIALDAGLAGGGDVILIPEIPFGYAAIAAGIRDRVKRGRLFSIIVVAEGATCPGVGAVVRQIVKDSVEPVRLGGVGAVVAQALEALLPYEVRYVVLGHVQRGGPPTPFDRILAARFGAAAVSALAEGAAGTMVALRGARIERVPLAEVAGGTRAVDPAGDRVLVARSVGTIFGDEPA